MAALDLDDYARTRTCQPFTGFRAGTLGREPGLIAYDHPISYGIRRCEFDEYLLRRSAARLLTGQPLKSLVRERGRWIANGKIEATIVIGAGGHFCPVARHLNPEPRHEAVVAAQEIEFHVDAGHAALAAIRGESPELYFWPDLLGYGWCVRKGEYLNIGAGRLGPTAFPAAVEQFKTWLRARGLTGVPSTWKGHAYLLNRTSGRRVTGEGLALVGDAAGLALAPSGEGILAAIESGAMAAEVVLDAFRAGSPLELDAYRDRLADRFGPRAPAEPRRSWPPWVGRMASAAIFRSSWMTRRWVIEDAFLHQRRSRLAAA